MSYMTLKGIRRMSPAAGAVLTVAALALAPSGATGHTAAMALPTPNPTFSDAQWLGGSITPPTQANCASAVPAARRCFTPTSMRELLQPRPAVRGRQRGPGRDRRDHRLVRQPEHGLRPECSTPMGLPHMCGEPGVTCAAGTPTFTHVYCNGKTDGEGAAAGQPTGPVARPATSGRWRPPRRGVGARDRAEGEHPQRHHQPRRDAGRAGLPGDDERRAVHRRQPPGDGDLAELRLRRGGIRQHPVAAEPAPRVHLRGRERCHRAGQLGRRRNSQQHPRR